MSRSKINSIIGVLILFAIGAMYQNCGVRHVAGVTDGASEASTPSPTPTPVGAATTQKSFNTGKFTLLPAGITAALVISGGAQIVRDSIANTTDVNLLVTGLIPNTNYMSHVHAFPCSVNQAGGHYKIDPSNAAAADTNEIWPLFTTDATGTGTVSKKVSHLARPDAQSVVVHGSAGEKLICADLLPTDAPLVESLSGRFVTTAAGTGAGVTITGMAAIVRKKSGTTEVTASFRGVTPNTMYMVHVHNLPCSVMGGGTHYMVDPTIAAPPVDTNEIWPMCTSDATGTCRGQITVPYVARPDALSVVIHNPADAVKYACADLNQSGGFVPTQVGLTKNIDILGKASMVRSSNGKTTVDVSVKGLKSNSMYMAHVHDRPCSTGGGGHYKIDYSITAVLQANEIWLHFDSDASGNGGAIVTVDHSARVEAQSIVFHDPTDNGRLSCVDLW